MAHDDQTQDASVAFEALRAEVALMRAAVGTLAARAPAEPPDYAPTLGAMHKTLKAICEALKTIGEHPALNIPPQTYASEVKAAAGEARRGIESDLRAMMDTVRRASDQISQFPSRVRTRGEQRAALAYAAGVGAAAGVVLWAGLSAPIARALPQSWQVPEKMAAATLHLDRWAAGSRLMQAADPRAWDNLVAASQVWRDNAKGMEACASAAAKAAKPQACKVTVGPGVRPLQTDRADAEMPQHG
jgi:hypothetical protein